MHVLCSGVCNGCSRSSKVIDLGTNRKRVCNFLLVISSNLAPFQRYCRFSAEKCDPTLFYPNFGGDHLGVDWRYCGSQRRRP